MHYTKLLQLVEQVEVAIENKHHIADEQIATLSAILNTFQNHSAVEDSEIEEGVYTDGEFERFSFTELSEDAELLSDQDSRVENMCEAIREFITNTERETIIALLNIADEDEDVDF